MASAAIPSCASHRSVAALALDRIAHERPYARKLLRGERRGVFGRVPSVHVVEG